MQYRPNPGAEGICPPGWHIPTLTEFHTLSSTAGEGNALKEIGQGIGPGAGTNASGFSALLAGVRYGDGYFDNLGRYGWFWSSTQFSATSAPRLGVYGSDTGILLSNYTKYAGFSVRCIKE